MENITAFPKDRDVFALTLDDTEFHSTLQRFLDLSEVLAEVTNRFIDRVGSLSEFGRFVTSPASGADEVVIRFQTSDRLLEMLSALEAMEPHLMRIKEIVGDIGSH